MQKSIFLYLIICTTFSWGLFSQNLKLEIKGHTEIETATLDSLGYRKNHKNYVSVKNEVDSLQKTLYKFGYIENDLKPIIRVHDSLFLAEIQLKKKYTTISIYYDKTLLDPKSLNGLSKKIFDTYFIIPFSNLENTLSILNTKIANGGFPFSKLYLSNITMENENNLKADLIIDVPKQKRLINAIVLKGYEKFPASFLKYYLKIKRNQTFNLNAIKEKTAQLNNLRFASEIKAPEVLFTKDSTTLYLYLQKTQSNAFDGFLGFGTNEDTNRLQFDGYLNLNLTNNLNYGESFRLLYKSDENDQQTFETSVSLPYLLKSPVGFDFALRIFKRDSSFSTVHQNAKLHYQINTRHKIYSGISAIQSSNLLNTVTNSSILDYKTSYYTLAYEFLKNQGNNLLFPVNTLFYFETNFGRRKQLNLEEQQSLLNFEGFKIFNLDTKNSLFFKTHVSMLNSNTYFENELIRFGGINSIRGFEENSIYASLMGVLNTEYRYQVNNTIYIHSITDLAYFENKILNTQEKLLGIGFGFGILTNTGLLKLNYANGNIENSPFKLSNSKIHISLVANF